MRSIGRPRPRRKSAGVREQNLGARPFAVLDSALEQPVPLPWSCAIFGMTPSSMAPTIRAAPPAPDSASARLGIRAAAPPSRIRAAAQDELHRAGNAAFALRSDADLISMSAAPTLRRSGLLILLRSASVVVRSVSTRRSSPASSACDRQDLHQLHARALSFARITIRHRAGASLAFDRLEQLAGWTRPGWTL